MHICLTFLQQQRCCLEMFDGYKNQPVFPKKILQVVWQPNHWPRTNGRHVKGNVRLKISFDFHHKIQQVEHMCFRKSIGSMGSMGSSILKA